jgi:hypothetical protein
MIAEKLDNPSIKSGSGEEEYCEVCWTNILTNDPLETFKFECKHRFCNECVRSDFELKIKEAQVDKLVCMIEGCGKLASNA